ncbi:MAG: hypothetical protein KGN84_22185, partial [Acidobacteriota bacterium]|nr:hypothetical protein [Acidobacteriota bacterium]
TRNNGLYTNEWIIGDAKNNEIAMYELGTAHTKLWRSSRNDWFNGTTGFYWGNNNAKDMSVKMEYLPDPQGPPEYVPFVPAVRDLAWQNLYHKYEGQIDEQFGFKAYDSAPLTAASTMDAKVVTSGMAKNMMVWAAFGRPNESVWAASSRESGSPNHGLFPGGYYLMTTEPPASLKDAAPETHTEEVKRPEPLTFRDKPEKLWKGWVLPASDADTWFVAGSAAYYRLLQTPDVEKAMQAEAVRYRGLKLAPDAPDTRFRIVETQGVLFLDALRRKMGNDAFLKLMSAYFAANTTKTVTAQSFLDAAKITYEAPAPGDGPAYLPSDIARRLASAAIVYGTVREAATNRYAAEQLQLRFRERDQREVPIYRDYEVSDSALAHNDVIFIGRPETNSALAPLQWKLGLDYKNAVFRTDGRTYASERNALIYATKNPGDAEHMVLIYAGNSPLETARSINVLPETPAAALEDGKPEGGTPDPGRP